MPITTVVCAICGREVTKRATLSLKELNGTEGRACRSHTEVAQLAAEVSQRRLDDKLMADVQSKLRVMSAVALVRWLCTLQGMPLTLVLWQLEAKLSKHEYEAVVAEIARVGEKMTEAEVLQGIIGAAELRKRMSVLGIQ